MSIKLPNINIDDLQDSRNIKKIANYLLQLDESLRYQLGHIDEDNLTDQYIKTLTARRVVVESDLTNILIDPDVGIQVKKGDKKQFYTDAASGDLIFSGKLIGTSMESPDYAAGLSGMKIDLDNSSIDAVGFQYANGLLEVINGKFSGTLEGSTIKSTFPLGSGGNSSVTMELTDTNFETYRTVSGVRDYSSEWNFQELDFLSPFSSSNGYASAQYGLYGISIENSYGTIFQVDEDAGILNGSIILTRSNYGSLINTSNITPSLTSYGNINFNGSVNAASVDWVQANFVHI